MNDGRRCLSHPASGGLPGDVGRLAELWQAFLEAAPAGVAIFDREMRYLEVSARWMRDYGLEGQDIIGRSHYEVFPEIDARWKGIHGRCLAGAVERCDADPFPRGNGETDWVRWEIRPWRHAGGEIGGIVIFSEIITERVRAEEALKASEARYRALIEQAPEAIVIYDVEQRRFIQANRNAELLFACGQAELLRSGPKRFYSPVQPDERDVDETFEEHSRLAAAGLPVTFERQIRNAQGLDVYCEVRLSSLPAAAGQLLRGSFIDITERKKAETTLRRVASTLQGALLPQSLPSVAGLRFDAIYVPGSSEAEIGGDWYDAFVLPDGRVGITIGDVTGQGVTAAVAMGRLRQAMQSVAFIRPDPVAMLEAAELALRSCTASSDIATAFAAVFDPASRTVLYASGGHPAPLLRLPDGTLQELDAPGKLLGLKSKSRNLRSSSAVLVPAGSFVAFYTDGLTEATRDVFTIEARLHEALRGPAVISAEHPAQALHDAVLDTKSHDDLAILTLSVGG